MKALVINLGTETDRMAFQVDQLSRLGLPFSRLEAVTPETVSPPRTDPYWTGWERPLRTTEMAAMASHRAAWTRIAASDGPSLVLEDDAVLMPAVPAFLHRLSDCPEAEYVTLETRGRRKRIARQGHGSLPMHRLWQDRTGAAAYVLWPGAARKLLNRVAAAPGLADAVLCAAYELSAWQAVPALAVQLDHCVAEGFAPPIATDSAIGREALPNAPSSLPQRARRVASQVRMGIRSIAHPGAQSVVVPLTRD